MGAFQSKKSYQVEKEEKKKGVVEQRKRSSNKPDVARNTLQMKEEAKQNILEAEKRSTIRSLSDIETNNPENIKSVQSSKDVQSRNVETKIKSAESINKPGNVDVTNTKVVQNNEDKPINTENIQSETETKDAENIKKPEENLIRTKIVEIKEVENNENISQSGSKDMIKNEDVQSNKEETIPLQTNDQPTDVSQTSPDQPVQQEPEDSIKDKPLEGTEIVNKSEETSEAKKEVKFMANDNKQETETIEAVKLEKKEENINETEEEEKPTPKGLLEEIVTESEAKQDENTRASNEAVKLNNEIKDDETFVEEITVIDVHSPIEAKKDMKDETHTTETKIEGYKVEIKNEENVDHKINEKRAIETPDLNKIEVYRSDESHIEETKLHENKTKTEESNKDNIKFDVEVYTYKEDNQEKIIEIEETSVSVTSMKLEDTQSSIQKHEVADTSLKQSKKETKNIASSNNDNNNLEESCTINEITKSEKEPKQLSPNHVEIQTKIPEEKIDPFLKIREIEEEVKILKEQVILFSGTTKDKDYLALKEMLVRCMIKLDDIVVADNDELRNERRKIIKFAQDSLDTLQRNVVKADASSGEESDTEKTEKVGI